MTSANHSTMNESHSWISFGTVKVLCLRSSLVIVLFGLQCRTVGSFVLRHHSSSRARAPLSARPADDVWNHRICGKTSPRVEYELFQLGAMSTNVEEDSSPPALVGDDAAAFDLAQQKLTDWVKFTVATGTVLAGVAWVWVLPNGLHGGDIFLQSIQSTLDTTDPAITVAVMLTIFAIAHSGLAGLRTYAEPFVGARAWRVLFAVVSLPLALSCISYFVNHAHEGARLWDVTSVPGLHTALWITNFVSFLFLYPSTFNLLEIAAIERPQLHLWETGIIRITRHPQAAGQVLWCAAHTLWLGTSTAVAASSILVLHHLYSVWHGDRRLATRHGEAFEYIKEKTSIVPFAAILDGRQELPDGYYKEFLRLPYAVVIGGTVAAYFAHPYMQAGAALLRW